MGRSVSRPSNACVVVYAYLDRTDDAGDYDAYLSQMNFDDAVENLRCDLIAKGKSFSKCDKWNGEDHAILESSAFYIGVSEYFGLVAVWAVPRERDDDEEREPLIEGIRAANLEPWLVDAAGYFGETLRHVATFSNGEAVFERRAA